MCVSVAGLWVAGLCVSEAWRLDVSVVEGLELCRLLLRADGQPAGLGLVLPTPAFAQQAMSELRAPPPSQQQHHDTSSQQHEAALRELLLASGEAAEERALQGVVERVCGSSKGLARWSPGMRTRMAHDIRGEGGGGDSREGGRTRGACG